MLWTKEAEVTIAHMNSVEIHMYTPIRTSISIGLEDWRINGSVWSQVFSKTLLFPKQIKLRSLQYVTSKKCSGVHGFCQKLCDPILNSIMNRSVLENKRMLMILCWFEKLLFTDRIRQSYLQYRTSKNHLK